MALTLKTKPLKTMYKELGIDQQGKVQQYLGKTVADNLKKYVSFDNGVQASSIKSINDGRQVIINVPYAKFQAEGKVMIGVKSRKAWARKGERKIATKKDLVYHNGKTRGSHPFERMKADKAKSILNQVSEYARRNFK